MLESIQRTLMHCRPPNNIVLGIKCVSIAVVRIKCTRCGDGDSIITIKSTWRRLNTSVCACVCVPTLFSNPGAGVPGPGGGKGTKTYNYTNTVRRNALYAILFFRLLLVRAHACMRPGRFFTCICDSQLVRKLHPRTHAHTKHNPLDL